MAKTIGQRSKHHGTLELRGKVYRARWEYHGRVFTRSTRTGNRREAERILEEFTRPFWTTDDKEVLQHLEAKVAGRDDDLAKIDKAKTIVGARKERLSVRFVSILRVDRQWRIWLFLCLRRAVCANGDRRGRQG